MKTSQQIEQEFRNDLKELLQKYNATIEADDYYQGYPESGQDIRMLVEIPSEYVDDNLISERTEIDLGRCVG